MESLGLVAAGFDFIVDQDNQWVFLELNEAGQFLFIHEWCEEHDLVKAFVEFIGSNYFQL